MSSSFQLTLKLKLVQCLFLMRWNIAAQGNLLKEGQRVGHLDIYIVKCCEAHCVYLIWCKLYLNSRNQKIDRWWASNLLEIKTNLGLWNINVIRKLSFLSFYLFRSFLKTWGWNLKWRAMSVDITLRSKVKEKESVTSKCLLKDGPWWIISLLWIKKLLLNK